MTAGIYRQLAQAADICPGTVIHPGTPRDPGLEQLFAAAFR